MCQQSGCSRLVHHVCSIKWAASSNLEEVGIAIFCREHHPKYCHKFVSGARAIPNPTTNADSMDDVLFEDSNTGEFGSSAVNDSLKSPDGMEIHRTMPGSAES